MILNNIFKKDVYKRQGISAYGLVTDEPIRADGYCLLIDRYLYDKYKLDPTYAWFWGVTKLESKVLQEQKKIKVVKNHENMTVSYTHLDVYKRQV